MANVRRVYLENQSGDRIDCLLKTSFFNDLSGLGFASEYDFRSAGDGFFYATKEEAQQQTISGKMSFLNRANAYADYRTFTSWLNSASRLSIVYIPYGAEEYYIDVRVGSMSKGELDTGGFLSCDIEFFATSPWYSQEAVVLSFDGTFLDKQKQYDYAYDYIYGLGQSRGELSVEIDGDYKGGINFTAYGGFADPILSLIDAQTLENYGYLDLTGQTFASDEALVFRTTFRDSGAWKLSGTEYTSIVDNIIVHQGRDVFFRIPPNKPMLLRFSVAGTLTTPTDIKIFRYWRTR